MPGADHPVLVDALERLDARLAAAVAAAEAAYGRTLGADPYRGLYLTAADAQELLARGPLGPAFVVTDPEPLAPADEEPFARFAEAFGLGQFELDVILLALAPELDVRYERIYGFLQDDVTRHQLTIDLALTLLCGSRKERLERLNSFHGASPLARAGMIVEAGGEMAVSSRVTVDNVTKGWLLGAPVEAAIPTARLVAAPRARASHRTRTAVAAARALAPPMRLWFSGDPHSGHDTAALAVAAALRRPLLRCDGGDAEAADRIARLERAVLHIVGRPVTTELACDVVVADSPLEDSVEIPFEPPTLRERRATWRAAFAGAGVTVRRAVIDDLAARFRLSDADVDAAARDAARLLRAHRATDPREAGFAAARACSPDTLVGVATRIRPVRGWNDLVLPEASLELLAELVAAVKQRPRLVDEWGFRQRLPSGSGLTALFAGSPGTGKTLAAEVVAAELGLDLFRVELAGIVSKYIGETEKNLDRVFAAAEGSAAVLLFDEADALFGKRSEVRDAHDRYANIEVSYLLQKLEQHDGVAILATNQKENLDEAFLRRLSFVVRFPFPNSAQRRRLWELALPEETPCEEEIDLDRLAATYRLTGAGIRNVVLAAAASAAERGKRVTSVNLVQATIREFEKAGKALVEAEARVGTG